MQANQYLSEFVFRTKGTFLLSNTVLSLNNGTFSDFMSTLPYRFEMGQMRNNPQGLWDLNTWFLSDSAASAGSGGTALQEEALFAGQLGRYVAASSFQLTLQAA